MTSLLKSYGYIWFFAFNLKSMLRALVLTIYLCSCQSPHFYRPKPVEPVILTQSKQSKVNLISDNDQFTAVSYAYSPAEHLGITTGAGYLRYDRKLGESYFNPYLAVGYYRKLSLNTLIETYVGAAFYTYKNRDDVEVKEIRFYNYFLQPSFAIVNTNIEVTFTLRADYFKRYKTGLRFNSTPDTSDARFAFLKYNNYLFFQPGCSVKVGFKYIKFQVAMAKSNTVNEKYSSIYGSIYNGRVDSEVFDHAIKWSSGVTVDLDIFKKTRNEIHSQH